jgi:transcriptional regulator with XRE-family HTH domain
MLSARSRVLLKAAVFKAIAAQRNITLDEFARELGFYDRHFYRLLGGQVSPSPKKRAVICAVLGRSFDELFELESEKEVQVSESSGPGSPGVYAPHTPVDANRGTRIPAADQRDARNGKPA